MAWRNVRPRLRGWMVCAAALTVVACGDDGPAPPVTFDAGDAGGGGMDAGDGGGMDGALDGGDDGSVGDGGVGPGTCRYSPAGDRFELATDSMRKQRPVSIAPRSDGFLVAWAATQDGAENAFARWIPSGGSPGAPRDITDDFSLAREPAVALGGDDFLVSWVDNSEGNFELWARPLDATGAPTGSAMRLTSNDRAEQAPVLITRSPGALLAWIEAGTGGDTSRKAWTRLLDASGGASGGANEITAEPQRPTRPRLAQSASGTVIAWTDSTGDDPHAWLQKLGSDAGPQGDAIQLDAEGNVAGNVDVTLTEAAGAAVFDVNVSGVRQEVRFRPLDGTGEPTGSERSFLAGSETGTDASIASFAGGFAVAYRALSGEDVDGPTIRLAFLTAGGDLIETTDLATAEASGGSTEVAVSFDGNILVGWSDRGDDATTVTAARVRCSGTLPGADGGVDGGVEDSGMPSDGGMMGMDATALPSDGGADCADDPCTCPSTSCTDSSCGAGETCEDDGCGDTRCLPSGHRCGGDGDCAPSSSCVSGVCVPDGSDCNDSRDCPLGFACEGGSCVDRRIECDRSGTVCPYGYYCHSDPDLGQPFCLPVAGRCATNAACPSRECRDVDGDGASECAFFGSCSTNADCSAAGQVCGSIPTTSQMCQMHGPCASGSDCASGWSCLDLWGDGVTSCVPDGGSCTSSADCSEHAVCGSPSAEAAPECVSGSFG